MWVVSCTADGGTRLEARAVLDPGPGEALLELLCCGLCGTDLFKLANANEREGTVLGHEVVGTVVAVGRGVSSPNLGQRVVVPHHVACGRCPLCARGSETLCPTFKENLLAPGGFAEYVLVRERAVQRAAWVVPGHVPDAAAAFLEPAACVLRGLDKATLRVEDGCVVVLGAGSMGLLHLLLVRSLLPQVRVVVCDPMEPRRRTALTLGASVACATGVELEAAVRDASAGLGADAVFDTVGGRAALRTSLAVARGGGTVVLFAHAAEGELADYELNPFFKTEQRVVATYSGAVAEQQRVAELLASGRFDPAPLVTHRLPLSRFDEAVHLCREREALKILLEPVDA